MSKRPSSKKSFELNVTNLKFIGAAFDEAIKDLQIMKGRAKDRQKRKISTKIAKLQGLKLATSRECPQNWYFPFETDDSK